MNKMNKYHLIMAVIFALLIIADFICIAMKGDVYAMLTAFTMLICGINIGCHFLSLNKNKKEEEK